MAPLFLRKQNTLELLHRFHETGDEALIEAVLKSQQTRVYRLCLRELGNEADAQDAAQTVLMRLVQHAGRIETDLDAWLARTCKNTCISLVRSAAARRKREANIAKSNREAAPLAPDELTEAEARDILQRCLAHLDEADAQLLHHRFVHGTSQSDLAQMLGISQQAVSKRLRRVLASLKGELNERGVQSVAGAFAGLVGGSTVVILTRQAALHTKLAVAQVASFTAGLPAKAAAVSALSLSGALKTTAACAVACIGLKGHAPTSPNNLHLPKQLTETFDALEALGPMVSPIQDLAQNLDQGSAIPTIARRSAGRQQPAWSPTATPLQQLTGHPGSIPLANPAYALIDTGSTPTGAPRHLGNSAGSTGLTLLTDAHIGWRSNPLPAANRGGSRENTALAPPPVVQYLPATVRESGRLLLSDVKQSTQQTPTESPSLIERVQRGVERVLGPSVPKLFNSLPSRTPGPSGSSGPSVPSLIDLPNLFSAATSTNEPDPATIVATNIDTTANGLGGLDIDERLIGNETIAAAPTAAFSLNDATFAFTEPVFFAESHHALSPSPISLANLSVPEQLVSAPLIGPVAAVPEPGTAALVLLVGVGIAKRRRRHP